MIIFDHAHFSLALFGSAVMASALYPENALK
jgi:hypothetical protein